MAGEKGLSAQALDFIDPYTGEKVHTHLPNKSKYEYLLERNHGYMNYTALTFAKQRITFEELHHHIDEYARALYHKGIRQGDVIGVCGVNTPETVYLLYALDKIGAIVVGLSPLNTEFQMRRDLELTTPKLVISVDMMYQGIKGAEKALQFSTILYSPVESYRNPLVKSIYKRKQRKAGNYNGENLKEIIDSGKSTIAEYANYREGALTDIMFTGGSTGIHKGVDLSGNGLNCVVKGMDYVFDAEAGMIHLGNIPVGHMVFGRMIMHYSLCSNMELALTLKAMPADFYGELVRTRANAAVGGPVHWESLIDNPAVKPNSLPHLQYATSGGEAFKRSRRIEVDKILKMCGSSAKIGDGLGITEAWATTHINNGCKNTSDTLGYPLPITKMKIVDPDTGKEVKDGEPGILHISSPAVMIGYHNNEEETKKVLYEDDTGMRWYIMGDIVRKTETGECQYIGRLKRNFVCGVDNIYPEEIESLLLNIPDIREVAVTKIPDNKKQFLPKYHISVYHDDFNREKLEQTIAELVQAQMGGSALPGYIEYTTEPLPRTGSSKLDITLLQKTDDAWYKENHAH